MKPYAHQLATIERLHATGGRLLNTSDPGTGKTYTVLQWFAEHHTNNPNARMVVLAPKAICHPAWGQDAKKFVPHLRVAVATGTSTDKRKRVAGGLPHILVTNHDSVTQPWFQDIATEFSVCVVDESTAFKNHLSIRGRALLGHVKHWPSRIAMSGTPMPNSVLDLWAQLRFVEPSLVSNYTAWRSEVCLPVSTMIGGGRSVFTWEERPGIREALLARNANYIVRYAKEDCLDLPPQRVYTRAALISAKTRAGLQRLKAEMALALDDEAEPLTVAHAGALAVKLLQLTSGFVYLNQPDGTRKAKVADTLRYDLVTELVSEREHSLVAVRFRAQADFLAEAFGHAKISYAIIDGNTTAQAAQTIVQDFQAGKYRTLICQPQSVSHGLTLTRADTVIWVSPTFNAEHFMQFNARIDRIGQTRPTEVICVAAEDTYEEEVYARLNDKINSQQGVLDMLRDFSRG